MSDWDPEAVAEQMRQLGRDWAQRWPQLITCHVERPARLRGYIATLSTRRDGEDRPFLYLIDEGQWVTADNGHGYRDEIGDADWPQQVDEHAARAVLDLASHAGWGDYSIQQLVSGIAAVQPRLILDHLLTTHRTGKLPTDVLGLATAFEDHGDALITWMVEHAERGDVSAASAVVGLVVDGALTEAQAQRLHTAVDGMDESGLLALAALLGNIDTWPLRQPELARRFVLKARELGVDTAAGVRAEIAAAMHLGMWGWTDGESPELESARAAATACAEAETDPELREDFETTRARFERDAEWLRRRDAEDDDEE